MSNKFIDIARQNKNTFNSNDEFRKHVIYNYQARFTTMSFTQIYLFDEKAIMTPEEVEVKKLQVE